MSGEAKKLKADSYTASIGVSFGDYVSNKNGCRQTDRQKPGTTFFVL